MKKKKIMIADDDPGILDATKTILGEFGYEVEATLNGETVRNIQKEYPSLILLDLWMSGVDGRDICKHLKSQKETEHIPIIILSANNDTKQIAHECGADDFLAKPFQMTELLTKVEKYVS